MKINNVLLIAVLAWCGMAGQMSGAERCLSGMSVPEPKTERELITMVHRSGDINLFFHESWSHETTVNKTNKTSLMVAAQKGWEVAAGTLLGLGTNVNSQDSRLKTALIYAAESGSTPVVALLLDHGAENTINQVDWLGDTALMHAARSGSESIVELLLDHGADATSVVRGGKTALMIAAEEERTTIVDLLLKRGAKITINHIDSNGFTALMYATSKRTALRNWLDPLSTSRLSIVNLLLRSGADVTPADRSGKTALKLAAKSGELSAVTLLLDFGANINDGFTLKFLVRRASEERSLAEKIKPIIEVFLTRSNITTETITEASKYAHDSILYLFEKKLRSLALIKRVLEAKDINAAILRESPTVVLLVFAAQPAPQPANLATVAQRAILLGADVRAKDSADGETPLVLATKAENQAIVQLLLDSKQISIEDTRAALRLAKDGSGIQKLLESQRLLQIKKFLTAASESTTDAVVRYLSNGIAIDETNELGETALMWAAAHGNRPVVEFLLDQRANINAEATHKETALTAAVQYKHPTIVTLLLDDPRIKTDDIKHALRLAVPDSEIRRLLQDKLDALQLAER